MFDSKFRGMGERKGESSVFSSPNSRLARGACTLADQLWVIKVQLLSWPLFKSRQFKPQGLIFGLIKMIFQLIFFFFWCFCSIKFISPHWLGRITARLIFSKKKAIFCYRSDKCEMLRVHLYRRLSSTCKYYNGLFSMFLKVCSL